MFLFSTVKLVPNAIRNEPINIGVIIEDTINNLAYRKITDNWDEINRRTNIDTIPGLESLQKRTKYNVLDNYLESLPKTQDSIQITEPRQVSGKDPLEILKSCYDIMVSIK